MIQTWTWEVEVPLGTSVIMHADRILKAGNDIMGFTGFLLGTQAGVTDRKVWFSLKVSGKDRWACQAHARDIGEKILQASRLYGRPTTHISTVIEPNRRGSMTGKGRTPRPRPAKSSAASDI